MNKYRITEKLVKVLYNLAVILVFTLCNIFIAYIGVYIALGLSNGYD